MADIDYLFGRCNNSNNGGRCICIMFVSQMVLGQDESNLCGTPGCVGTQEPTMNYLVTDKMVVLFQFRRVNQLRHQCPPQFRRLQHAHFIAGRLKGIKQSITEISSSMNFPDRSKNELSLTP